MAMMLREMAAAAKTAWLTHAGRVPQRWSRNEPVVSLTFDDVPLTAYQEGLPVLDRKNVKATFYACTDFVWEGRAHLGPTEIAALAEQGHEIGCHTETHYSVQQNGPGGLAKDCSANHATLQSITGGRWPRNFAFPHGEVAVSIKQQLARTYRSLRSTRKGINYGTFDLGCLKAVPAYHGDCDPAFVNRWIDAAIAHRGWLIFYTHGVSAPGKVPQKSFDVRADQLSMLIDAVHDRGLRVQTVDGVLSSLGRWDSLNTSGLDQTSHAKT